MTNLEIKLEIHFSYIQPFLTQFRESRLCSCELFLLYCNNYRYVLLFFTMLDFTVDIPLFVVFVCILAFQ